MTQRRTPRERRTPTPVRNEIHRRAIEGELGTEIYAAMTNSESPFLLTCPSLRTVQDIAREVTPPDRSGVWRLGDAASEDASLVLPALAAVIERTAGRTRSLSNGEAEWIARLTTAASDIPPWQAYSLARSYLARSQRGESTESLDQAVAFAPWKDGGKAYLGALSAGWINQLHWMEFSPEVEKAFIAAMEAREAKEPTDD